MKGFAFGIIVSLFLFISIALAAPVLHDSYPNNNTYIGGGTKIISINITEANLNTSSVVLRIISLNAYQQGENWDTYTMSCANTSTEWNCTKSISFAIAGSDTVELFYFEANDTSGATGSYGAASNPLRFTLDRNPPAISFVSPANDSYVSRNKTIQVSVVDASSGVNNNSVQYSTDGSQWTGMTNSTPTSFTATWNTTTFTNNQSVTLYGRASDVLGNIFTGKINVTVDNELPEIKVILPLPTTLAGNAQLQVNASDYYSGVDLANVRYTVGSLSGTLGCTGTKWNSTCTAVLSTASLSDGNYSINFNVSDNGGNSRNASIEIKTKNTQPTITITEPANNAFIKGNSLFKTTLANTEGSVTSVEISFEKSGGTTTKTMTCNGNFTSCNNSFDTTSLSDGAYTAKAKAVNSLNLDVSSSITVTVDNKKPSVTIIEPATDVKGDFNIKAEVVDDNVDKSKVSFVLSSFTGSLVCTSQTPSKLVCSTAFNSKQLNDGRYFLNVSAEDKAGNSFIASKEINIVNQQSSTTGQTSTSQTGAGGESPSASEQTGELPYASEGRPFTIRLPFNPKYVILGVVTVSVLVIIVLLVIMAKHRLGKTIITD